MRVLLLTETAKPTSGWGRIAFELAKRYRERGIEVTILTEDDSGAVPGILKNSLASLKSTLLSSLKVRSHVKGHDIVHALDAYPYGLIGALATWGSKKPLVMTAIGTYAIMPLEHPRLRPFMKWAYRRADRILPIVHYTTEQIKKRVSGLPHVKRVLLGVDIEKFSLSTQDQEPSMPFFLSVGALKKRRGNHYVLPAIALVKKAFPSVQYRVVGSQSDSDYMNFLYKEVARLDLTDNVHFLGTVSENELLNLYQTCVAFVGVPDNTDTNFAGFHLVYLEANAMGKPVIAGAGYGTEETLIEGENGFLVNPKEPESIAKAFGRLLADPKLRATMRTKSRAHAETLSWDRTADEYIEEYQQTLRNS